MDNNLKFMKIEGPLGRTMLNVEKHDISGCLCIYADDKGAYESRTPFRGFMDVSLQICKSVKGQLIKNDIFNFIDNKIKSQALLENLKQRIKINKTPKACLKALKRVNSLYRQKIQGVSRGYFTYLRLVGVGYRVFLINNTLTFKLGFSHLIKIVVPSSIRVFLPEPTLICIYGLDKNEVTQIGAKVQEIKRPSPYKGKGIRVLDAEIKLKIGKKKS
jgi:ribosomal protein L6P/L9E